MNRQAVVIGLSLIPFVLSSGAAFLAWEAATALETVWRMIIIVLVWIPAFAGGTQLFWRVVGLLAPKL
ncbi:MAG: hypothetical protein ABSB53_07130 [Nitrososphaerales archaeon]|jgi:cytochrome bd-type quinol oxidase subunit 2